MQDATPEAKALTQAIVARLEAAPQLVGLDIQQCGPGLDIYTLATIAELSRLRVGAVFASAQGQCLTRHFACRATRLVQMRTACPADEDSSCWLTAAVLASSGGGCDKCNKTNQEANP